MTTFIHTVFGIRSMCRDQIFSCDLILVFNHIFADKMIDYLKHCIFSILNHSNLTIIISFHFPTIHLRITIKIMFSLVIFIVWACFQIDQKEDTLFNCLTLLFYFHIFSVLFIDLFTLVFFLYICGHVTKSASLYLIHEEQQVHWKA